MIAWVKAAVIAVSAVVGVASVYVFKLKPDNPVEEVCEKAIEKETGLDIDLTPGSPETDNKTTASSGEPKN